MVGVRVRTDAVHSWGFIMASPQLENGYTAIANEILHALMACKLLNYEFRVLTAVVRKTYGWKKKSDWISNSQLAEVTGIAKPNITRTVNSLIDKKVLIKEGKKIGLQKDWERWQVEWYVDKKVISRDNSVISPDNKKLSHQIPTKEKKETIQKKLDETSSSQELKANQNDMSWNKQSDDYEEGVIDMDGDGELQQETPKRKLKTTPEMKAVFALFSNPEKKVWHMRQVERDAAQILHDTYGYETLVKRVARIEKEKKLNAGDNFMPIINSPSTMLKKMEAMEKYLGI